MACQDLSLVVGDRIGPDRLALWMSMRLFPVFSDDTWRFARVGWGVRRGLYRWSRPRRVDLSAFLDRVDPWKHGDEALTFAIRAGGWA